MKLPKIFKYGAWFHGAYYPLFKIVFEEAKRTNRELNLITRAMRDQKGQDRLVEHFRRDGQPDSIALVEEDER